MNLMIDWGVILRSQAPIASFRTQVEGGAGPVLAPSFGALADAVEVESC